MAGSLKRVPESKGVGYCCFIGVMPAEGMMISAGFHCCTRVAQHHHQVRCLQQPHVSGTRGENLAGSLH